jgi:regulator of RNase E activity RraA
MATDGKAFGFRVITKITRPADGLIQKFREVRSTDLADAMREANFMDSGIRPMYLPMAPFVGPAVTVTMPRGSHFPLFKLGMQQTQSGDVLVVNARSDAVSAVIGGNIAKALKARGVAGLIIDGAARDVEETRGVGLPVYVRHVTPNAGNSWGPGEINVPIACGGVVVNPGDLIVADEDGIAVVPPFAAEAVLARAVEALHKADKIQSALARGEVTNIENITTRLVEEGAVIT